VHIIGDINFMLSPVTYWNNSQGLSKSKDYHLITGLNPINPTRVPVEIGKDETEIELRHVREYFSGTALLPNFTRRSIMLPDGQQKHINKFFMLPECDERHYAVFSPNGFLHGRKLLSLLEFNDELQGMNRVFALIPLTHEIAFGKREDLWDYLDSQFKTYTIKE